MNAVSALGSGKAGLFDKRPEGINGPAILIFIRRETGKSRVVQEPLT